MNRSVLAIAAHPDDIEFVMAGTMMQLRAAGWELHYFNIANGCCGSTSIDRSTCAAVRLEEAREAASLLDAKFYPPICDDLEIFYTADLHRQVAAVVRQAKPSIVLTHSMVDYMEDHQNAARLAIGAAFVRAMPNFVTQPSYTTYDAPVAIYHAQPHGNRDPMGQVIRPSHFVDVTEFLARKRQCLAAHRSQDQWLDTTQGISSYLETMEQLNAEVGSFSRVTQHRGFTYAEGWRKHLHLGLADANFDPLASALAEKCILNA